jgi:photosystem II stability/assembly factor-like uncharacterized protein
MGNSITMKTISLFLLILSALLLIVNKIYAQKLELLGPPGAVWKMQIHPQYPDYLYSSDAHNGSIFRTTDGGLTNECIDPENFNYINQSIVCDNNDPDVFYIAFQPSYYKTTNGGKNWKEMFSTQYGFYYLEINPLNSDNLFVISNIYELWESYDGGNSWSFLAEFNNRVTQISISHQDTALIYVATENELYKSTNSGTDWEMTLQISPTFFLLPTRMVVNPYNDQHIDYLIDGEFYRSTDGGYSIELLLGADGPYPVIDFATDFSNPNLIYATRKGNLYRSTDAGETWVIFNDGLPFNNPEAGEIEMSWQNHNDMYISTLFGIYKTTNGGNNWFYTRAAYTDMYHLNIIKEKPGTILVGTRSGKILKTTNYGYTWYRPHFEPDSLIPGTAPYFFSMNPSNESEGFLGGGVYLYKTTDYGDSWRDTGQLPGAVAVQYHPYKKDVIFAGQMGIFGLLRSTDDGNIWDLMPDTSSVAHISNQIDPNVLFSYEFDGVRRSTDLGYSWELANNGILDPLYNVEGLAMPANSQDTVYCVTSVVSDGKGHLYKTINGGNEWFRIDSVVSMLDTAVNITSIAIDNEKPYRIFIGLDDGGIPLSQYSTNGGLYLTEDDGKSWIKIYNGRVDLIKLNYNEPRYIYFGTKFGLMRMRDSIVVDVQYEQDNIPSDYNLSQNFPNPFNPATTIKYQIPQNGFVTLKAYNILGKEIVTIVNEYRTTGKYEVNWNAANLPSGVYIYTLRVNGYTNSKKMLLLK